VSTPCSTGFDRNCCGVSMYSCAPVRYGKVHPIVCSAVAA
jgi:hypothetical protein